MAGAWIASNEPYSLDLSPPPDAARIARFLKRAGAVCAAPQEQVRPAGDQGVCGPLPAPAPAAELIIPDASYTSDCGGALTLTGVP